MEVLHAKSPEDLLPVARRIAGYLPANRVVAFHGAMGAGKTTLIRALADVLGITDTVTSPTFALVNQYSTPDGETVNHFDFYRIENVSEAFDLGYEEYFYGGDICLVEWPEKIGSLMPDDALIINIEVSPGDGTRTISIGDGPQTSLSAM